MLPEDLPEDLRRIDDIAEDPQRLGIFPGEGIILRAKSSIVATRPTIQIEDMMLMLQKVL